MNQSFRATQSEHIASAKRTLAIEVQALEALAQRLDTHFDQAVELLLACRGRIVVTGLGKSGHIARKIAATLASTGTPAFFMHGAEAMHGDLGMLTASDTILALSYSGSAPELLTVVNLAKRMSIPLIALTGNPESDLARSATVHLNVHVEHEACPLDLAPTASTTASVALGDALAVACLEARGFSAEDFARSHPGGALGRRLLTRVSDIMRSGPALPIVYATTLMPEALQEMSRKAMGMTIVINEQRQPIGIFTDGDLRRLISRHGDIRQCQVKDGMTPKPYCISAETLAIEAATLMDDRRLNQLVVTDSDGLLLGALHMHDLLAAKVI
ncbi:MAG TPA: KpsF/GutQ family sugar-phosphate isomerase [Burkholderiaceae bacterium]|nr:KpsF/GutQ family sugar-phosphate isomerase [Burkholderiaceae bacterium]